MVTDFSADVMAIRMNGDAMPGRFVGMNDEGKADVQAPNGRVYSFPKDALVPIEEAKKQLYADRVTKVAASYKFKLLYHQPERVVSLRCYNPVNPIRSDYIITVTPHSKSCSCPAFAKSGNVTCKHLEALESLPTNPDAESPAVEAPAPKTVQPEPFRANDLSKPVYSSDDW